MTTLVITESAIIDAPPSKVYAILSDYHVGHAAVLPKEFFTQMTVEQGGQGTGTIITVQMSVYGSKSTLRMAVDEPQPGVVLREKSLTSDLVTTFTFEPLDDGTRTRLTLYTTQSTATGFRGLMERVMNPPITRRIYRKELALINDYVAP